MTTYYEPIIYRNAVHEPLDPTLDKLSPDSIPVSAKQNNQIRVTSDGLYVGNAYDQAAYYVSSSSGTDQGTSGSKAQPYQTLDYALERIVEKYGAGDGSIQGQPTVALKAGEVFPLNITSPLRGQLKITFYGDPQYGDFDSPPIGSPGTLPGIMADLQRPIIQPSIQPEATNGVHHFGCYDSTNGIMSSLELYGVRVDLPTGSIQNSDYCSFLTVQYECSGKLILRGAIINKLDANSSYGAMGIHSRVDNAVLQEFSSQFWINGAIVQSGAGVDVLANRQYFIIFYPDFPGNIQTGGSLLGGTPPTGLLRLTWSNVAAAPVLPGKTNLATYPMTGDPSFGLSTYFFNLQRDAQSRPLNVMSAALL